LKKNHGVRIDGTRSAENYINYALARIDGTRSAVIYISYAFALHALVQNTMNMSHLHFVYLRLRFSSTPSAV
jgi:hypothetical protein